MMDGPAIYILVSIMAICQCDAGVIVIDEMIHKYLSDIIVAYCILYGISCCPACIVMLLHSGNDRRDCNAMKLCCICLWLCIAHKHANWWYVNKRLNSGSVVETYCLLSLP